MVKGPSFDKISKVQDSLKSVPGYEEIFQLVPRASHENGDPEVGVCEQVKGGQSLGSDWSDISELIKINLSSALRFFAFHSIFGTIFILSSYLLFILCRFLIL